MNQLIEEIFQSRSVTDADGQTYPLHSSISPREGEWLFNLVRERGAVETLEIGLAQGLSALHFCEAHRQRGSGRHTGIDPYEASSWHSIGLLNLERAGLMGHFRLLEASSERALPSLLADGEKFDFIFIDGLHLFDHTILDFFYADKLLNLGGLLMMHDLWMPAIRKVAAFILRNLPYREIPPPPGKNSAPRRLWRYLRNLRANRFDLYSSGLFLDGRLVNSCVLEKTGSDQRHWTHYRSF